MTVFALLAALQMQLTRLQVQLIPLGTTSIIVYPDWNPNQPPTIALL